MVEAESEVMLLPSFAFASMLCILMTHAAVALCGGWCCQIGCFSRYILRPVYSVFWLGFRLEGSMEIFHSVERS